MSKIETLVELREMLPDDFSFIRSSWCKSLRSGSYYHHSIPEKTFYAAHKAGINDTLENAKCLVATPANEPNIIVGYLVYEERGSDEYVVLHYCYVKKMFRMMGLANLLISIASKDRQLIATHYTNKIKKLVFNPYMFKTEHL